MSEVEVEEGFDIKKILGIFITYWYVYAIGLFITGFIAFLFVRYTDPIYQVDAKILIEEDSKGSASSALSSGGQVFSDLGGLFGATNNVDNEIEILQTKTLMLKVVKDLQLNITYYKPGKIKDIETFQSPYKVVMVSSSKSLKPFSLLWKSVSANRFALFNLDDKKLLEANFGETVTYLENSFYLVKVREIKDHDDDYMFKVENQDLVTTNLLKTLVTEVPTKEASVIDLSMPAKIPSKGEFVLDYFIRKYIQSSLDQKNRIADSTLIFIANRLTIVSSELNSIENAITRFKGSNKVIDPETQAKILAETYDQNFKQSSELSVQLEVIKSLKGYLRDEQNNQRVIPSNLVISNPTFVELVSKYNTLMIEKDRASLNYTEKNPILKNIDVQLANLRSDMLNNLTLQERAIQQSQKSLRGNDVLLNQKITGGQTVQMGFLQLSREQKIKEALYLYLVQKREEVAISKSSTMAKATVIENPKSTFFPISPNLPLVAAMALIFGLALPAVFLYFKNVLNNRIILKGDILKKTSVPILGEISHNTENEVLLPLTERSIIAEQLRGIRTNLQFALGGGDSKVIMITSSMSEEGKSFISLNLSRILSLTDKKVVLLEMDLRKPKIRSYLQVKKDEGFTNYLVSNISLDSIIVQTAINENLYMVPSGAIPPNPTELLLSKKTDAFFDELKKRFDYIVIDCPPIGLVTDAQVLSRFADVTLYIVRQGYTFKNQLDIVNDITENDKIKNVYLVVNDVRAASSYGYGYGYGYGYSYSYGYGGYGDEGKKPKPNSFFSNLFKRK